MIRLKSPNFPFSSKIRLLHGIVLQQASPFTFPGDSSDLQDIGAVAESQSHPSVLFNQQDSRALPILSPG